MTDRIAELRKLQDAAKARLRLNPDYVMVEELERMISKITALNVSAAMNAAAPPEAIPPPASRSSVRVSQREAAMTALRQQGRPLSTEELIPLVESVGAVLTGNKNVNLSATMSRDDRFYSIKTASGNKWWIRDEEPSASRDLETPIPAEKNPAPPHEGEAVN